MTQVRVFERIVRRATVLLAAASLVTIAACGSDDSDGPTGNNTGNQAGNGSLSATVNGAAFSAITAVGGYSNNTIIISSGSTTGSIALQIYDITRTGTFQLTPQTFSSAIFSTLGTGSSAASWSSGVTGGSGSITVTTLTASRAVGTFSFVGGPVAGTAATSTRNVTNGSFDVTFAATR